MKIHPAENVLVKAEVPETKYRAFISYSHRDKEWGDWLHKALETYRVPRRLVGRSSVLGPIPRRLFPIFRDREELPTSSNLSSNISTALSQSQFLIAICSPNSASSRWVNEEIKNFKQLGREDRILSLIVAGEPNDSEKAGREQNECFPPAIRLRVAPDGSLTSEQLEPIAADVRPGGDGKTNAKLKLIAGLIGVPYDELKRRDRRRQMWQRAQIAAATLVVASLLIGVALWGARALRQQQIADDIDEARQELLQGNAARAYSTILDAFSRGGSGATLEFLLHQAKVASPQAQTEAHSAGIYMANFSPDGTRVVTASIDGTAKIWDAATGKVLFTLGGHKDKDGKIIGHKDEVNSAFFSPDGKLVVTASDDHTAILWNALTGEPLLPAMEHKDKVYLAVFDGKGERVVTTSQDHEARIWRVSDRKCIARLRLQRHPGPLLSALFSPDGHFVLTADDNGNAVVWEAPEAHALHGKDCLEENPVVETEYVPHASGLRYADFSPDGKLIAAVGRDGDLWLWRFDEKHRTLTGARDLQGHKDEARRLAFSKDGEKIVTTSRDGTADVWNARTGKILFTLEDNSSWRRLWTAAFSPNGRMIATADAAGTVKLWDGQSGRLLYSIERHHGNVFGISFSPDGARLVTAGGDHVAYVWDVSNSQAVRLVASLDGRKSGLVRDPDVAADPASLSASLVRTLSGGEGYVEVAHFNPNSRDAHELLVAGHQAQLWDAESATPRILSKSVTDASFDAKGNRIGTGGTDGEITIYDSSLAKPAQIASFRAFAGWVLGIQFVPGQNEIVAWGEDPGKQSGSVRHLVKFFDSHGRQFRPPVEGDDPVLDPAGTRVLTLSSTSSEKFWYAGVRGVIEEPLWQELNRDFDVDLWYLRGNNAPTTLKGHTDTVYSARFSSDGRRAVTASADKTSKIWDTTTGALLATLNENRKDHSELLHLAAFSPGDDRVVTASQDGTARIWTISSRQSVQLKDEAMEQGPVYSAAFSPDGALLATLANDNYVRVWDAFTGQLLARLSGHRGKITTMEFSSDGERLISGGEDHTARIWDIGRETITAEEARKELRDNVH